MTPSSRGSHARDFGPVRRIGLTQRVEVFYSGQERRDCLDQAWARLLWTIGFLPIPLSNSVTDETSTYLDALDLCGVILTGGNDLAHLDDARTAAAERDEFEFRLVRECHARALPILGICRGMQVLNVHFGGSLDHIEGHAGTEHTVFALDPTDGSRSFSVNSFHDYAVLPSGVADNLDPTVVADDGSIEGFRHKTWRCCEGFMWHPERPGPSRESDIGRIKRLFEGTK